MGNGLSMHGEKIFNNSDKKLKEAIREGSIMAKDMRKRLQMVSLYSAVHFLVDFSCTFFMFRSIAGAQAGYTCLLLYNFFAFAMQMPLGIVADKLDRNYVFAALGCILAGAAYGLVQIPVAAVAVIGTGNALFHIGGGIDVLNVSEEKLGALGVFVSPGAFGVYLGRMLGKGTGFFTGIIPLSLAAAAALVFLQHRAHKGIRPPNAVFSLQGIGTGRVLAAGFCFFLVVCLRSYIGLALDFPWKNVGLWGTALVCAVVFGKATGGFAADRFGLVKTATASLGLAAPLLLAAGIPVAGTAAVLLINATMPVTLWAMAKILPGAKGFAFGLLTFGLFLGFLPVYLGMGVSQGAYWRFALLAAASLGILLTGLSRSGHSGAKL